MNTAESDIDALEGRMNTAESDIDAVEGRMNTAESDIDALEGRMNTAETAIGGINDDITVTQDGNYITAGTDVASNLGALDAQVKINEDNISDLDTDLGDVTQFAGSTTGNLAYTASSNASNAADAIMNLDTALGKINHLADNVTTANGKLNLDQGSTVSSHLVSLAGAIGDRSAYGTTGHLTASETVAQSLTALDGAIGDVEDVNDVQDTGLTNLYSALNGGTYDPATASVTGATDLTATAADGSTVAGNITEAVNGASTINQTQNATLTALAGLVDGGSVDATGAYTAGTALNSYDGESTITGVINKVVTNKQENLIINADSGLQMAADGQTLSVKLADTTTTKSGLQLDNNGLSVKNGATLEINGEGFLNIKANSNQFEVNNATGLNLADGGVTTSKIDDGAVTIGKIAADAKATSITGSDNLATDSAVKSYVDNSINALDATASQAAGADGLSLNITQVDGKITSISGAIAANTYDAYGAADTAEQNAKDYTDNTIAGLDATASQAAGTDGLSLNITQVDGKITSISGAIAANTYDAYGAADAVDAKLGSVFTASNTVEKVIDNMVTESSGIITFKDANGSPEATAYSKDKADATFAGLAANNTFTGNNTFNGNIIANGNITSTGNISAVNGTFSGNLVVTGTSTLGTLNAGATTVTSLNAGSGTIETTGALKGGTLTTTGDANIGGALNGTTATFSGLVTSNGLNAGSGTIETTGALKGGTLTTTGDANIGGALNVSGAISGTDITASGTLSGNALNVTTDASVGGKLDVTGDASVGGKLDVTGNISGADITASGTLSGNALDITNNAKIGGNLDVTGDTTLAYTLVDDDLDVTGDTYVGGDTYVEGDLAAKSLTFTGDTNTTVDAIDTNTAVVDGNGSATTLATTATIAETVGDLSALTSDPIGVTNADDVASAIQSLGANVETATGGQFAADGKWAATVDNSGAANGYAYTEASNVMEAMNQIAANVGTADQLSNNFNGVETANSVNQNINALNGSVGDVSTFEDSTTGNLSNSVNPAPADNAKDVATAINNIDATLGKIHGLYDGSKVDNGVVESRVGANSNLAKGTTVSDHLVMLDNAIGNRQISSTNEAINKATWGNNGNGSLAKGLEAAGNAIGTADFSGTRYAAGAKNVTDAVKKLDANMGRIEHDVRDLRHDFRTGMASMAAMTALVPNARGCGDTSLSLGTGAYDGHTAMALGAFHYLTDNLLLNAGAAWGNTNDVAYRMGVTWSF